MDVRNLTDEIDRLRAENAELKELLNKAYPIVMDETAADTDWCKRVRAILARTAKADSAAENDDSTAQDET